MFDRAKTQWTNGNSEARRPRVAARDSPETVHRREQNNLSGADFFYAPKITKGILEKAKKPNESDKA